MKTKTNATNWKPLAALTASIFLSACGGGGGGSSEIAAEGPAPTVPDKTLMTPANPQEKTVTGAVTKGPVAGATVQLFAVDQFGNAVGNPLGSAQTDANGNFTIPGIDPALGDLLVVASDGAFLDESDQEGQRRIVLGPNDTFLSVLPQDFSSVAITPFTTAAVIRGRVLGGPDGTFGQKFTTAVTALSEQAGFDILSTIPANPTAPDANATNAQKQYALLLGGLANLVNNVAVQSGAGAPTYNMVVAVTFDLVDGQFDGQYFGSTQVPGTTATPVTLPQNINFSNEVNRFRNNNAAAYSEFTSANLPSIEVASFVNNFPVSNAGADLSVSRGSTVTLDGSQSLDPDNTGVFYQWTQVDNGATTVSLSDATAARPSFTAPTPLVGTELLSFQLLVIDPAGFTSVDTMNVAVQGALPTDFYVIDQNEIGDGIGTDVDGGARITLTDTTNGTLLTDIGSFPFTYTSTATALTINFPVPFLQDDFDEVREVNGVTDLYLIEERITSYTLTLNTDNPNGDLIDITQVGNEVILPLDQPTATALQTTALPADPGTLLAYDVSQSQRFDIVAGAERTLLFDSVGANRIQTLQEFDELYHEVFTFDGAGRGLVRDSNVGFGYEVNAAGNLVVTFDVGGSATYINLVTRPTGDVVATEYNLAAPFIGETATQISDVRLSIPRNASAVLPSQLSELAGVYTGVYEPPTDLLESGVLYVRLNPDGTGAVNFDFPASASPFLNFDNALVFSSDLGVCWSIEGNDIVVSQALSINVFPGSFSGETSPAFCSSLTEENIDFQFRLTHLDNDGTTYKFFDKVSHNRCEGVATSACTNLPATLENVNLQLRVNQREALNDLPPVAFIDALQTPPGTPITIDPTANDLPRGLDSANPNPIVGYQINKLPFQGTISETITLGELRTGPITYTPNAGIQSDAFEYQAIDSKGNKSVIQLVQVVINGVPTANAGVDISASRAGSVQLDASLSADLEGPLSYSWSQVINGSTLVTLSDSTVVNPTFTAPSPLAGDEVLTFEVTVTDSGGFTSVDTVNVTVQGALPVDFYVIAQNEIGDGVGTDVDGGARITLTDTANGILFTDIGLFPFTYTSTTTALTINFPVPFLQDDFDEVREVNGVTDLYLIEERITSYTFTLNTDNPNGDLVDITQVGSEVILPLDQPTGTVLQTTALPPDPETLLAYDVTQSQRFEIVAGAQRTLLFDSVGANSIQTLQEFDELYHEVFTFDGAGRGLVRDSNVGFGYEVNTAGNLVVTFDVGGSATYINLVTRPTGDVVATEYNLAAPFSGELATQINDVRLSIPKNPAATQATQLADRAGVYSGVYDPPTDLLDSGILYVRLNPDGTGALNFDFPASASPFLNFDNALTFSSDLGICWSLDGDGIVVNQAFSLDVFPGSFSGETSPAFCSALLEEDIEFQFRTTALDNDGTTYKSFAKVLHNRCQGIETSACTNLPASLENVDFELRITQRELLNDLPPVAFIDVLQTPPGSPITIDPTSNDLARGLDSANPNPIVGYQINKLPFQGAISETITLGELRTGPITYTPNAGIQSDAFEYQAIDSKGNKSVIQLVQVLINGVPTANAGGDILTPRAGSVQLDASLSTDLEGPLSYSWSQVANGSTLVTLSDSTAVNPTFTAPSLLAGEEVLIFEVTVIDAGGFTAVDTVNVTVQGAITDDFYVFEENDFGDGNGTDVDGGGRIILADTANGFLFSDTGTFAFTYTQTDTQLVLNFPVPYVQDDFDEERDVGGTVAEYLIQERVNSYTLTLVTDNANGDAFTISTIGDEVVLPLNLPNDPPLQVTALDPTPEPLLAYEVAQAQGFNIVAGDRRTLLYDAANVILTLEDDELYHKLFSFGAGGTGQVLETSTTFTYTEDAFGNLDVTFSTGDSAKYINLVTRPTGDVVATEYTLSAPLVPGEDIEISDVRLSIPENTAAVKPTTRLDVAGVYTGTFDSFEEIANPLIYMRLNPDGTGSLNLDRKASTLGIFDFDNVVASRSSFGICWDVDANQDIVINRAFSINVAFPGSGSSETDTTFCSGLIDDDTEFRFVMTQLDTDGTTYKFYDRRSTSRCFGVPRNDCVDLPLLDFTGTQLRIVTREVLNAPPPVASIDAFQTPDNTPVNIDLLSNDFQRGNAIVGVEIGRGPFNGTITNFDPVTGILDYQPNPGITSDVFEYQAVDSLGNKSQIQLVQIHINPCAFINGQQGFFNIFTKDCDYTALGDPINPALGNVNLDPLPDGGVHRFFSSLVIGEDFSADIDAASTTFGTLTIAAGTTLEFSNPSDVLMVRRGSQLNVNGTQTDPVIMTSSSDILSQRNVLAGIPGIQNYNDSGQWGGVAIHGFGVTNFCSYTGTAATTLVVSGECHAPDDTNLGHYGGADDTDSSGSINYLQIKHAGGFAGIGPAKGLFLGAVGSGTSISNVQVYSTADDGIQVVGGAANLSNVSVLYAHDDSIDIDEGYSGSISNALLIQDQFTGDQCFAVDGILDYNEFTVAQIDGFITQGLNSDVSVSNLTCVVSGVPNGLGDNGGGVRIGHAAFVTMTDSLVIQPGADDANAINQCISLQDRSLQAAEDGDLTITGSLFACPDRTAGNILPLSLAPTESFLTGSGNQFSTTLISGLSSPPPVASAGAGLNLIEGAPLIFSPAPGAVQIDSALPTATASTFFGAVQQGVNDWTQDWTFGLHPDSRLRPLWYETPIIITPRIVPSSKGQLVTLNASQSVGQTPGLTYQWSQIDFGVPVVLTNPNSASTQLTAPGSGTPLTQDGGTVEIELIVTDANGLQSKDVVTIPVGASIPEDFYSASESLIPFEFDQIVEGGVRISLDLVNNMGIYQESIDSLPFNWTDTATTFTLNFPSPIVGDPVFASKNIDGDVDLEDITRTENLNSLTYTLLADNGPKKSFQLSKSGFNTITVVSNPTITGVEDTSDEIFTDVVQLNANESVVSVDDGLFFDIEDGGVMALPTNLATAIMTLTEPDVLQPDLLTFFEDGTGNAFQKGLGFTWNNDFGRLNVMFNDGETAEYTFLFEKNGADAVGIKYTRTDTLTVHQVDEAVKDDPLDSFISVPSIAGIYETSGRFKLDDGSFVEQKFFYRLHPDMTGQLEFEAYDPVTGLLSSIDISSTGICWEVLSPDKLVWHRVEAQASIYIGTPIQLPGTSECGLITGGDNTFTRRRRDLILLADESGRYLTYTENQENQDQVSVTPPFSMILDFASTFTRSFEPVTFFSGNPPIAFPDDIDTSIVNVVNVVSNDADDDGPMDIDPASVIIVVPPKHGTAVVDAAGLLTYTPDASYMGFDVVYYRVLDQAGNLSTIGEVIIFDGGGA